MVIDLSFLELLKLHKELDEMFLCHQEALLSLEIQRAIEILARYEERLLSHMEDEEELLIPLYQERAGRIEGGPVELFLGEHKKMRAFIAEFHGALQTMRAQEVIHLRRSIIALMDRQCMYKLLVEHHDHRERNILYPWRDRITTVEERTALLGECVGLGERIMAEVD